MFSKRITRSATRANASSDVTSPAPATTLASIETASVNLPQTRSSRTRMALLLDPIASAAKKVVGRRKARNTARANDKDGDGQTSNTTNLDVDWPTATSISKEHTYIRGLRAGPSQILPPSDTPSTSISSASAIDEGAGVAHATHSWPHEPLADAASQIVTINCHGETAAFKPSPLLDPQPTASTSERIAQDSALSVVAVAHESAEVSSAPIADSSVKEIHEGADQTASEDTIQDTALRRNLTRAVKSAPHHEELNFHPIVFPEVFEREPEVKLPKKDPITGLPRLTRQYAIVLGYPDTISDTNSSARSSNGETPSTPTEDDGRDLSVDSSPTRPAGPTPRLKREFSLEDLEPEERSASPCFSEVDAIRPHATCFRHHHARPLPTESSEQPNPSSSSSKSSRPPVPPGRRLRRRYAAYYDKNGNPILTGTQMDVLLESVPVYRKEPSSSSTTAGFDTPRPYAPASQSGRSSVAAPPVSTVVQRDTVEAPVTDKGKGRAVDRPASTPTPYLRETESPHRARELSPATGKKRAREPEGESYSAPVTPTSNGGVAAIVWGYTRSQASFSVELSITSLPGPSAAKRQKVSDAPANVSVASPSECAAPARDVSGPTVTTPERKRPREAEPDGDANVTNGGKEEEETAPRAAKKVRTEV